MKLWYVLCSDTQSTQLQCHLPWCPIRTASPQNRPAPHLKGMIWSRYHFLLTYFMQKFIRQKYTPKYCRAMSFLHRNMHISTTNGWNQMGRDSNLWSEAWLLVGICIITFGKILIALLATQKVPNIFGFFTEHVRRFWLHAVQRSP